MRASELQELIIYEIDGDRQGAVQTFTGNVRNATASSGMLGSVRYWCPGPTRGADPGKFGVCIQTLDQGTTFQGNGEAHFTRASKRPHGNQLRHPRSSVSTSNDGRSRLAGKVAVVTGGSGGIGAAAARALADEGARVVVGYHRGEVKAQEIANSLPGPGHGIVRIDLRPPGQLSGLAEAIQREYGRADILVNAAGFTTPVAHADLNGLTDEMFDAVLTANVRGPFAVVREMAPLLRATGDGVIVNISSISGFTGSGSSIAYCAAKAALDTMTLSLARVLGPEIRVLCVSPGAVATDFVPGRNRDALERIAANTPLRRVVEPEDVAEAVLTCVINLRASTGIKLPVDGGRFLV